MRIVVFGPNWIGDAVMATPALRALRQRFAGARIVGVLKPLVANALEGGPWFDDRILFDPKSRAAERKAWSVLRRLRAERCDLAVLFPNSFRTAALALLASVPERVGYARGGRGWLLTDRLEPPAEPRGGKLPTPIVEYYLNLVRHLGCQPDSLRTELYTTAADEQAADAVWTGLGLSGQGRVVALNTGGAFGPAKSWPPEHFGVLARRLVNEAGVGVLVVCGPGEREAAREIVARADHPSVVSLADQAMGIGLTKACIRRAGLLVTTDSGPRHFATPFQVPVLTLFGPTHIAWTRTYHPLAVHMLHPVPCGPCQKRVCPLGHHRCMRELDPNKVFDVALRMLAGSGRAIADSR